MKRNDSAQTIEDAESPASTMPSSFDLGSVEDIRCLNFGLVDYLNFTMKDSEQDETESLCSECGSGLAVSPPTRLSDTDSTIEALPVSSKIPLKIINQHRNSSLGRKKIDMKSLRWQSCQELLGKPTKSRLLQRQHSDISLRVSLQEKNLQKAVVEVYDGNVGVSIVKLPKNNKDLSPNLKNANRHCMSAKEGSVLEKWSPRISRETSRTGRCLAHEESGDSLDNGCIDSLAVEPSDTDYEQMDIDDCSFPLSTSASDKKSKRTCPTSKRSHLADLDVDRVLGILEDDGMGPGLSEDEMNADESSPVNCVNPSLRHIGTMSPHKILLYLHKDAKRRNNESITRSSGRGKRFQERDLDNQVRFQSSTEGPTQNESVSDLSQPTSAFSRKVRLYSDASQCDSSAEESDTGAELSDLERCFLNLSHRRNQLRKQDTNACLIAPPEFKIDGHFPEVFRDLED